MGVTFLPQRSPFLSGPTTADAAVALWAAAVVTNAGTVSDARKALVSMMVSAWKAAGVWAVIDDAWLLVAENAPQALTSLKQRRLAVATASPTFTADQGYAFNGTTQYLDTGFIPNTHKVALTGDSMHIAAYERTNVNTSTAAAGCFNFSADNLILFPRRADNSIAAQLNAQTPTSTNTTITDSRGLTVGSRNGTLTTDHAIYKNGSQITPFTATGPLSAIPTAKIFIGGYCNNTGVLTLPRASTQGFVSVGGNIPAAQQPAFYSALQSFMTAVGANV